jgi:hypothetical protein
MKHPASYHEPIASVLVGFAPEQASQFRQYVARACSGSEPEWRERFAVLTDEAIEAYKFETAFLETKAIARKPLASISTNARLLARALHRLDRGTATVLLQRVFRTTRIDFKVLDDGIVRLEDISVAANVLVKHRHEGLKRSASAKETVLIERLAEAYVSCFGTQPSWSRNGVFLGLIEKAFQIANLGKAPGETRLRNILGRTKSVQQAIKPSRGRKRGPR